ncbi:MAG: protein-export membrane protein SecD [Spirochaetes bacterium GWD1_27_9]|nr:MAG: protein-export membrane protein SecD [Spirochaetes bacterium GWB1_27_13]OHD22473.1 MAG: protein-export membrane protein SecD [Spirochaetes bacterium GWC1_27_15]OHD42828.1 MAG: protein-export membrane protein SecD [Spirochaetes bacterium GWD1_27_9]
MKKRTRLLIFLFFLAFGLYFLIPTIRWYYFYSDIDKFEASVAGDKLKLEVEKKVNAAMEKLKKEEKLDKELNSIREEFKKEVKKINRANPEDKISISDKITFTEMEKILLEKRKQKYVDSFFRITLENFYSKNYENKRKVKESIIKLGLDLQGGAYAVVTVNFNHPNMKKKYPKGITKEDREAMIDSAVLKIENRINKYGISETSIQKLRDQEKIVINLPGVKEVTELRQIIETVGVLEFKLVSKDGSDMLAKLKREYESQSKSIFDAKGILLAEVQAKLPPDTEVLPISNKDKWGKESDKKEFLVVEKESLLGDNMQILSATVSVGDLGQHVVNFELGDEDAKKWAKVTGDNVGKQIAIILDNVILQYPVVRDKITGGRSQITLGDSPLEELRTLALILKSGSMSAPLEISEENTVGASLGQDTIRMGLFACLIGSFFVLGFMIIWYSLGGVFADIAVMLNVLLLLAGMALFKGTLTLPGLAGIVLTIGMAVDANVIIYERIKEEFRAGKTFKTAVHLGFDKAFWTILDANLTTFAAGIGLSLFGTGPIKGFAVTLCLGIVSTLFTGLFMSRLMFDYLIANTDFKTLRVLNLLRGK